nr:immunoglobulin light chain junction region [Macaca mulatta]
CQHYSGLPWTF